EGEEGGAGGRGGVGKMGEGGEAWGGRRERHLRRHCRGGEGGGERPVEEAAPRKRMPHRFLTSGDAHAKPPFLAGRAGPPGARLALPMTLRNPQRTKAGEGTHQSEDY